MSEHPEQLVETGEASDALSSEAVIAYLQAHPDCLSHEPELLAQLEIPHPDGDGVISLVQRQLLAMRERHSQLEANIAELVQVARENEQVNRRLHALALELMAAATLDDVICATLSAMRDQFETEMVVLRMIDQGDGAMVERDRARAWCRDDPSIEHFVEFFRQRKVLSGQLPSAQLEALFGERATEVQSAALLPLKATNNLGLLALGHSDAQRFHPAKGVLFLTQLGELLSQRLAAVLVEGHAR